jgi:uncharacterized membrane protein YqjE
MESGRHRRRGRRHHRHADLAPLRGRRHEHRGIARTDGAHLAGHLLLALLSLFLFGVAMLLVALLVIVIFWDTHRVAAVAGMAGVFGAGGLLVALKLKGSFSQKPPLLGHTLAELHKDVDALKGAGHGYEQ